MLVVIMSESQCLRLLSNIWLANILITSTRKNLVSKVLVKTLPGTGEYSGSFQFCFVLFFSLKVSNLLSDGSEVRVRIKP